MSELNKLPIIGSSVKDLSFEVFHNNKIEKKHLSNYKGKWLILFFYPADFTFVCPTELEELANNYTAFQDLNTEILSISTDTAFVHKAWHDHSPSIKKIKFPMVADPTGVLCRELGVYIPTEGIALRGTFIINPEGDLVAYEVNDNSIGRNATELLRKLQAAKHVAEHGNEVCPASWQPGDKTLQPGVDLIGKI